LRSSGIYTRGQPNRESMAQGAANIVTGLFGGMGGCAMIGQSMINVNSGATGRLSGVATALFLIVSALVFASEHAKQIGVRTSLDAQGWKIYELEGSLFFASVAGFQQLFTHRTDPADVVIEFRRARVVDHSAIQPIDALAERYRAAGKRLHLRHLSPDCRELLQNARGMIEVNLQEDPRYRIADDKLA
jgi:sulfate permease, SulP family